MTVEQFARAAAGRRRYPALMLSLVAGMLVMARAEQSMAQSRPSAVEAGAACRYVAERGPAITSELIRDGILDGNNDGRDDAVSIGVGIGTVRDETLEIRPRDAAKDAEPVALKDDDDGWRDIGGFSARWLPYRGKVYTLHFASETLRSAVALGFIDAANNEHVVCTFKSDVRENLIPLKPDDADLCGRVAAGRVKYVAPTNRDEGSNRRETSLKGMLTLDFRNTGRAVSLALLDYASGAGRGCEFKYYDTVSNGRIGVPGESRDVLMAAQDINLSGASLKEYPDPSELKAESYFRPPHCGGVTPRWFEHNRRIFLDTAAERDDGVLARFRTVSLIENTGVGPVCRGEFSETWKVDAMGPRFR